MIHFNGDEGFAPTFEAFPKGIPPEIGQTIENREGHMWETTEYSLKKGSLMAAFFISIFDRTEVVKLRDRRGGNPC